VPVNIGVGIHPIHFDIVHSAAAGLCALPRRRSEARPLLHRCCWRYPLALLVGLMLIICIPELSLFLPRSAGLIR
jgi:C4-dicarboxylate transporter, DctM subunit